MSDNDHSDCTVHFRSDGLAPSPGEYSDLLVRIAADGGIAADEFSREGVVAELEDRMAALLGKETAISCPAGRWPTTSHCVCSQSAAAGSSCSAKAISTTIAEIVCRS